MNTLEPNSISQPTEALRGMLLRFVRARVSDAATAEDLTQEILLRASRSKAGVRDETRLAGWFFQIARNAITDYYRRKKPLSSFDETIERHIETGRSDEFDAEEQKLRQELNEYLRGVVNGLPAIYRDALIKVEFEGMAQVELAANEGMSVSAVKSRVQRARALVRKQLEECCKIETDRYGRVVECERLAAADCSCKSMD